jgi:hypothetical protein
MAPYLASSKHELIDDVISSGELSVLQMAKSAGCNKRTNIRISSNIRTFGSVKAPLNEGSRPRSIYQVMLEAICDHLLEEPNFTLLGWQFFCGTSLMYKQRGPASVVLLQQRAGQEGLLALRPESVTSTSAMKSPTLPLYLRFIFLPPYLC